MTIHDQPEVSSGRSEPAAGAADAGLAPMKEQAAPTNPSTVSNESSLPAGAASETIADEPTPSAPPAHSQDAATGSDEVTPRGDAVERAPEHPGADRGTSAAEVLFADDELAELRARWAAVQAAFVDDPQDCVQKADALLSDLVEQLTTGFANARSRLEQHWARGEDTSTEDLRMALMHYRAFFDRLLAV